MNVAVKVVNGNNISLKIYGGFIAEYTLLNTIDYQSEYSHTLEREWLNKYKAEIIEETKIYTFEDAFNEFLIGQTIIGKYTCKINYQYPEGVLLSNGYKLLYYGGGNKEEDYNESFILDEKDILIAKIEN